MGGRAGTDNLVALPADRVHESFGPFMLGTRLDRFGWS